MNPHYPNVTVQHSYVNNASPDFSYQVTLTDDDGNLVSFAASLRTLTQLSDSISERLTADREITARLDKELSHQSLLSRIPGIRRLAHV